LLRLAAQLLCFFNQLHKLAAQAVAAGGLGAAGQLEGLRPAEVAAVFAAAKEFAEGGCGHGLAGGVAANSRLRELLESKGEAAGIEILKPAQILCTDNGAMIACSAYYQMKKGEFADMSLDACPGLEF